MRPHASDSSKIPDEKQFYLALGKLSYQLLHYVLH